MSDDLEKLTPANPRDVEIALSLALTSGRALERSQSAEAMAGATAERLVAALKRSGFVIMRKPIDHPVTGLAEHGTIPEITSQLRSLLSSRRT